MAPRYQGQPAFKSMSGGINRNIYDPNSPAKMREREHQQLVNKRRAGMPYDPFAPAKMREKKHQQMVAARRRYRGKPNVAKTRKPLRVTHNKRSGPVPYEAAE